ncbi:hypothetical protein C4901_05995 [Acidiferrobacter sp. SPIII_3]|nr:hypothetical protein C4901_05995 [Acidiferrobacter sp. SPIII_3]
MSLQIIFLVVAGHTGAGDSAAPYIGFSAEHLRLEFGEIIRATAARRFGGQLARRFRRRRVVIDTPPSAEAAPPMLTNSPFWRA